MVTPNQDKLLTPREVALRFAVDPKTVTRWARNGLLPCIKTRGGHRRYRESVVASFAVEIVEVPDDKLDGEFTSISAPG